MRPKPAGVSRATGLPTPTKTRAAYGGRPVLPTSARADPPGPTIPPRTTYLPGDFFTSAAPLPPLPTNVPEKRDTFSLSALWNAAGRSTTASKEPSASSSRLGGREELGQRTFFTPTFEDQRWRQPSSKLEVSLTGSGTVNESPKMCPAAPSTPLPARGPPRGARLGGVRSRPSVAAPGLDGTVPHALAPDSLAAGAGGSFRNPTLSAANVSRSFAPSPSPRGPGGRGRLQQPHPSPNEPEAEDEPPSAVLSDAAWLGRLSAVIAHLHGTLPRFFPDPPHFPPAVFSPAITLALPAPPSLPLIGSTSSGAGSGGGGNDTGGRASEVHLRGARAYSLFFAAARASLGIVLREPYVRIESVRVIPPTEKEGFLVVPNQLPSSGSQNSSAGSSSGGIGSSLGSATQVPHAGPSASGAPTVRISRARLDRVVRVRVKVGGRLRLPSLGPASAVVEALGGRIATDGGDPSEREWTISNLYGISPLSARITRHTVESVYPLPGEGAQAWLSGQLAASPAGATGEGGGGGHQQGGCAGAVEVDMDELQDASLWRETKDDTSDDRRDGTPGRID